MPQRGIRDDLAMPGNEGTWQKNETPAWLAGKCRERGLDLGGIADWSRRHCDAHARCNRTDSAQISVPGGMTPILHYRHSRHIWNHLLEHLQPCAGERMLENGEAC